MQVTLGGESSEDVVEVSSSSPQITKLQAFCSLLLILIVRAGFALYCEPVDLIGVAAFGRECVNRSKCHFKTVVYNKSIIALVRG